MKNLSLIASALAMLGLTACEKGFVDGVADVAPAGQAANAGRRSTGNISHGFCSRASFVVDYPNCLYGRLAQTTIEAMMPSRLFHVTPNYLSTIRKDITFEA